MAEKLDNIDKEIERELHNLSLDELSSDADSVPDVDQSLPNSPAKDNVSLNRLCRGIENVVIFNTVYMLFNLDALAG